MIKNIEIRKSAPTLFYKSNFYVLISEDGTNDIIIDGINYSVDIDNIKSLFNKVFDKYDILKELANNQDGEGLIGGTSTMINIKNGDEEIKIVDTLLPRGGNYKEQFKEFVDMVVNDIKDNKDINSSPMLKRSELANKFYGYHSKNNFLNEEDVLNYLSIIESFLGNYRYVSDSNFVLCGRKKYIYDEITNVLNGFQKEQNPLYFVLGSLEEFMSSNNYISSAEPDYLTVRMKNEEYIKNGFICLEEKNYISSIILEIKKSISK